nr:hypothetical protein [Tanacetum cinerariifolium]
MDSDLNIQDDPWEPSLDIDDSDLHLTPQAKLLKEKYILLGWDGPVMSTQEYMKKVVEDEDFKSGSWISATDYVNANGGTMSGCLRDINNNQKKEKLDQVVAIVKSCSSNVLGDLTVTIKDLSGTIPRTVHYKVIGEGGYEKDIIVRAAMILANVLIFPPKPSMHYLNITKRNVVKLCSSELEIITIDVHKANLLLHKGEYRFLDVRTTEEFMKGHVDFDDAINIPYMFNSPQGRVINNNFLEQILPFCNKDDQLIVGCQSGVRSVYATNILLKAGFKHVYNMGGGYLAWVENDLPVAMLTLVCRGIGRKDEGVKMYKESVVLSDPGCCNLFGISKSTTTSGFVDVKYCLNTRLNAASSWLVLPLEISATSLFVNAADAVSNSSKSHAC